jgi:hypothetical protein
LGTAVTPSLPAGNIFGQFIEWLVPEVVPVSLPSPLALGIDWYIIGGVAAVSRGRFRAPETNFILHAARVSGDCLSVLVCRYWGAAGVFAELDCTLLRHASSTLCCIWTY